MRSYQQDVNNVALAWTKLAKTNTCKHHAKEFTQLLPAAPACSERQFRIASDIGPRWGVRRNAMENRKGKGKKRETYRT